MEETIDARGLACPGPVVLAKKALEGSARVKVLVDNETAVENLRRLALRNACGFAVEGGEGGCWEIVITREGPLAEAPAEASPETRGTKAPRAAGPTVIVFAHDRMGGGDDTLGDILLRAFVHTLLEVKPRPDVVVCYNGGVRLAVEGAQTAADLRALAEGGTEILVCGTCLNYYGLTEKLAVGRVSNMYEIAETLTAAGRIVRP
ncbi:MAG TPA: sulfurtransferase-like selenium metabolism protein YedF [Syntrophales bacterium]|nr:sulfurtransferase-like selenium metabolism protein YedF [Syntrophales bacterium]HPC00826.1 sulfurtransferase-like selenium metabolism protein YedF [Syntrophales bacterium]HRV42877.1 sulfurtransferase-like selenium metabolism protein YedF [Syntrophales bacterium]